MSKRKRSQRDYQEEIRKLKKALREQGAEVRNALDQLANAQTIAEQQDARIVAQAEEIASSAEFGSLYRSAFESLAGACGDYFEGLRDVTETIQEEAFRDGENVDAGNCIHNQGRVAACTDNFQAGRRIRETVKVSKETIERAQKRWLDKHGGGVPASGQKGQGGKPQNFGRRTAAFGRSMVDALAGMAIYSLLKSGGTLPPVGAGNPLSGHARGRGWEENVNAKHGGDIRRDFFAPHCNGKACPDERGSKAPSGK